MERIQSDPIIAELRVVRDAHAARFNYDVKAISQDSRHVYNPSKWCGNQLGMPHVGTTHDSGNRLCGDSPGCGKGSRQGFCRGMPETGECVKASRGGI